MRILLLTNEYPPERIAGTAQATRFLAEELAARGVQVTVVVNTRRSAPARGTEGEVEVVRLRPLPVPATRMAQRAAMLLRIAQVLRPDVIQGQSLSCGALAAFVGRVIGVPSVTYVQGLDLYESSGWAQRTYIRWALRSSTAVVAVQEDLRRRAQDLVSRPIPVIPHGLRLRPTHGLSQEAARTSLGLSPDEPIVLYVGRLLRIKGVRHLLGAFPRVLARSPQARLLIVGDGEEHEALRASAHRLGISPRVTFLGTLPHEDVIRCMRAADLLVLPSLVESFGIVLLEAMGCGLPVVASRVMGIPSLVEDGVNGFLTPPGDEDALADRITLLLSDPDLRARMGDQNRNKAAAYLLPRIADRFLDLWQGLLRQKEAA